MTIQKNSSNITQTFIIGDNVASGECSSYYTNLIEPCTGDTINFNSNILISNSLSATTFYGDGSNLSGIETAINGKFIHVSGDTMTGNLIVPGISATTISATTFYGDGSNLSGLITANDYTTGTSFNNNIIYFDRTNGLSAYTVNLSSLDKSNEISGLTDSLNSHTGDTSIHFTKESLNGIFVNVSGDTMTGTLYGTSISANTISATTFYGDGSQLINLPLQTQYWISGTSGTYSIKANNNSGLDATGNYSIAEGYNTKAIAHNSHAEGRNTTASGNQSHVEGDESKSIGESSHAEGNYTTASGNYTHSEGNYTTASGSYSHSEGNYTRATGDYSHAEGNNSTSLGTSSHAEGNYTTASGYDTHAEGNYTRATGDYSHAEGNYTTATGSSSHVEGNSSKAYGSSSHAEGNYTTASGNYTHSEGSNTVATGSSAHAEGISSKAYGSASHAEGSNTQATGNTSHAEGQLTKAYGGYSHSEGYSTTAFGQMSHSEGYSTTAFGYSSHAGGYNSSSNGQYSFIHSDSSVINTGATSSSILGGSGNIVNGNVINSIILGGSGITATQNNTVYGINFSGVNISATTFYGDGSQLTGINIPSVTGFVHTSGDTMTGNLIVPSLTAINDITINSLSGSTTRDVKINSSGVLIASNDTQIVINITGTSIIDTFADINGDACIWDYVVKSSSGIRAGTITGVWSATTNLVEYYEISTNDIGNTQGVILNVDISSDNLRLITTVSGGTWTMKTNRVLL